MIQGNIQIIKKMSNGSVLQCSSFVNDQLLITNDKQTEERRNILFIRGLLLLVRLVVQWIIIPWWYRPTSFETKYYYSSKVLYYYDAPVLNINTSTTIGTTNVNKKTWVD